MGHNQTQLEWILNGLVLNPKWLLRYLTLSIFSGLKSFILSVKRPLEFFATYFLGNRWSEYVLYVVMAKLLMFIIEFVLPMIYM